MESNDRKKPTDALKQEEAYKKIWNIAESLKSKNVKSWDFKSYILTTIFYKYLSQKLIDSFKEDDDIDYSTLNDIEALTQKDAIISKYGFFMLPSELFCNVLKNAHDNPNLNKDLKQVFDNIENYVKNTKTFDNFKGLFNDFNFSKIVVDNTNTNLINEKIENILQGINKMEINFLSKINVDSLGDAYVYLIGMYAADAGTTGGDFFTPQEVSKLLMKLAISNFSNKLTDISNIYDPACGSGSLLLQAVKLLGKNNFNKLKGQEINSTTYNLCRMNMFLHNVEPERFNIVCDDTLIHPAFISDVVSGEKFDIIVSNPTYSSEWKGKDDPLLINDPRYRVAGVLAPKTKADFAFILHSLYYLSEKGTACIVCFPGILYRGGAEKKIREYLVNEGVIDCIIQLPVNLFYGTNIATDIMILRKNRTNSNEIFFIDASNEFIKVANNNKLTDENIDKILNIYHNKKDIPYTAKMVNIDSIKGNDYSLNVAKYIEKKDETPKIDINELNQQIEKIVTKSNNLRKDIKGLTNNLQMQEYANCNNQQILNLAKGFIDQLNLIIKSSQDILLINEIRNLINKINELLSKLN